MQLFLLTLLALLAFGGNSLLCRMALKNTSLDPSSFTLIRIVAGGLTLGLIVGFQGKRPWGAGNWLSSFALFGYAICFSLAYVSLSTATGALLLFGAVQATMLGYAFWQGERLRGWQILGLVVALGGLVGMLWPGLLAPSPLGAGLMLTAGVAWGIYSIRGKGASDATAVTAGNFCRGVPLAIVFSLFSLPWLKWDNAGAVYALASGAITSGLGYAIWYTALRQLPQTTAATVQLSVPLIAACGGILLLGEAPNSRLLWASVAILGGVATVIWGKAKSGP